MFDTRFEKAVAVVLAHEGGYVHDKDDSGGETNFGISQQRYPHLNIKDLSIEQAKHLYYRDYWRVNGYDRIGKIAVATKVFDLAVNMGAINANRCLQRALRGIGYHAVKVDGILGWHTLVLVKMAQQRRLMAALRVEAANHYLGLVAKNQKLLKFKRGWLKRAYA